MREQSLLNRVTIDPDVMTGKPTISGLRITVEHILRALANGCTTKELIEDYPDLEPEDIQAVLLYATKIVSHERVFKLGIGASP